MEPAATQKKGGSAGEAAIGTFVALYAVFDAITLGLLTLVLAAEFNALVVFVIAAVVIFAINRACCGWLDREWDGWVAGPGQRIEKRLDKMRSSKIMRYPVGWTQRGSAAWLALAAALINAITVTVAVRLIGGQPVGSRRITVIALGYALYFAAIFSLIGWAAGAAVLG
jgi:hypothetical protein